MIYLLTGSASLALATACAGFLLGKRRGIEEEYNRGVKALRAIDHTWRTGVHRWADQIWQDRYSIAKIRQHVNGIKTVKLAPQEPR